MQGDPCVKGCQFSSAILSVSDKGETHMCNSLEVTCSNTDDRTDYVYIQDMLNNHFSDVEFVLDDEMKVVNDKLTILAMMILRTAGYTNTFKRNPKDNRKHIGKNIKELADVFGIEFR